MTKINNFINRTMCEYASIFPTVAHVLEHVLFVVGNGYEFNYRTGSILDDRGVMALEDYTSLDQDGWAALIDRCHAKEKTWASNLGRNGEPDAELLAEQCKKYRIIDVADSDLSEESLYRNISETQERMRLKNDGYPDVWARPYPLSTSYSKVCLLNENTSLCLLQTAQNLCRAWIRFLNEAIESGDYWVDKDPDPTKPAKRDYSDLEWTIKHRDSLVEQESRISKLLSKQPLSVL